MASNNRLRPILSAAAPAQPTSIRQSGIGVEAPAGTQPPGGAGRSGSSGGTTAATGTANNYTTQFQNLLKGLYETTFASNPIPYEQMTQQQLSDQITAWLRPGYDQAVYNRSLSTGRANAELDADAIARGMGASSFVTDVKSRNFRDEARDVALLESDYGATLAKNVSERLDAEKARALEVDMFNKEQQQLEYQMAYDAATLLQKMGGRAEHLDGSLRRGLGAQSAAGTGRQGAAVTAAATTAANCATFLSRLTPAQRAGVYTGTDAQSAAYRNEIIASVGLDGFYRLQSQYGA